MQKKMKNEKIQGVQAENMEREQETKEFLKQFYESPEAEEDTIAAKLKRTFVPKGKKTKAIADFAKDLMGEGGAGDVVIDDDMFEADTEGYKQQEKKRLSKRTRVSLFLLLVAIPLTIAAGFWLTDQSALADWIDRVFGPRKYYLISLVIVLYALLPFFMAFEGRKPEVRELVVLATMIALATAGRAAFFMTPSFKPIIAIVIISAIAFGAEAGFLVGSMTMLVSNFLFGQGPWTPWQMFAMGFIGFLSGILSQQNMFSANSVCFLCIRGRICNLLVVTLIRNPVFHDNCKFASFSQLTFCFNTSAHHINILLYDRHSQTCSRNLSRCCIAFPAKSLKQGWQEFFTHSDTCINYLSLYPHTVFPVTVNLCDPYGNRSP